MRALHSTAAKGRLAMLAIYLAWGSTYLAVRIGVAHFPPFLLASIRYLLPGAVLYIWTWRNAERALPSARELLSAAIIGFLLPFGGNGGVTLSEQTLPSGIAAVLIAVSPFWMVLFDAIRARRRVSPLVVVGLVVGWLGVILLVRPTAEQHVDPFGAAFALGGGVLWAAGSIYSRTAVQATPALRAVALQMLAGGFWLGLAGVLTGELPRASWSEPAALAILWLSVVGSLVGFCAFIYVLKVLPISTVSTYAFVNPLIAVLLGWSILHEVVTLQTLLAVAVTISGVGLILFSRARAESPKLSEAGGRLQ